jgi:hypothetical protein
MEFILDLVTCMCFFSCLCFLSRFGRITWAVFDLNNKIVRI